MYNVALISPVPFFEDRGTPIRIFEQITSMQRLGDKFDVFTYHTGRDVHGIRTIRIPSVPWYKKTYTGATYHKIYLDALLYFQTAKHYYGSNYDLIHAYLHEGVAIGSALKTFKKVPLVFDAQGSLTGEMSAQGFVDKGGIKHGFWRRMERMINNRADAIITSSSSNGRSLVKDFGISKEKVNVVKDGVDTKLFSRSAKEGQKIRKKYKIPKDKDVIVYIGVLHPHQGIHHLINAAPMVLEKSKNAHFLIAGFPNVDKYKAKAKENGVTDNVTFTGKVKYFDAPKYLSAGDVAVSAKVFSSGEGNEKIYNYMSMGLPTIVFDHSVNREILGDLGIYAKYDDHESLANNLTSILNNKEKTSKLGKQVRNKAVKEYSWDLVAKRMQKVYDKVKEK